MLVFQTLEKRTLSNVSVSTVKIPCFLSSVTAVKQTVIKENKLDNNKSMSIQSIVNRWDWIDGKELTMNDYVPYMANMNVTSYLPLPRFLIPLDISNDAKVLYALLLDRASISKENGYVEPNGTVRLYFTLDEAKTKLHKSRQVATRVFKELENERLIVRRRQGLGRPALITLNIPKKEDK